MPSGLDGEFSSISFREKYHLPPVSSVLSSECLYGPPSYIPKCIGSLDNKAVIGSFCSLLSIFFFF
ncbi:hypothetical protein HanRHA438_Chr17g0795181 [Helianthus annuus]|nr:hypothetical protein HanRHA438_Chr17g0795181 [Helianthus annuus]